MLWATTEIIRDQLLMSKAGYFNRKIFQGETIEEDGGVANSSALTGDFDKPVKDKDGPFSMDSYDIESEANLEG